MLVKITPDLKIKLFIFNIILLILAPIWMLSFFHYTSDLFPSIIQSQTLIPSSDTPLLQINQIKISSMLFNLLLLSSFYIQHIFMATLKYKINMEKHWTNYPIYQKYIYNFISSILVIFVFSSMSPQYIVLFQLNPYLNYFLLSYGLFFFTWANISMETSLLIPFGFKTLLTKSQLKIEPYDTVINDGITTKGMYGWMRHPMQSGCLFIIIFGSPIFTVQKIFYCILMGIGITIGVMKQQERLIKRYTQYKDYMSKVKARFIPYLI